MDNDDLRYDAHGCRCRGICFVELPCVIRVGDIEDARDLPEDLTPFITRTSFDSVGVGGFGDVWKCSYDAHGISTPVSPCVAFIDHAIDLYRLIHKVAVKAFRFPQNWELQRMKKVSHKKYRDQITSRIIWHFGYYVEYQPRNWHFEDFTP
jgi:hypothetical protein